MQGAGHTVKRAVGTLLLGLLLAMPFGIVVNIFLNAGPRGTPVWKSIIGDGVPLVLGLFAAAVWRGYFPRLRDRIKDRNKRQEDWLYEHPRHMVGLYALVGVVFGLIVSQPNPDIEGRVGAVIIGSVLWGFMAWLRVRRYQRELGPAG